MPADIKKDKPKRTYEELKQMYELEKKLSAELRKASKEERRHLYMSLYDEYFRQFPQHPVQSLKDNPKGNAIVVGRWMIPLRDYLYPEATFMEIGPGGCGLCLEVAKQVKKVYAIDVSSEVMKDLDSPPNFELVVSEGTNIPVPAGSVNIAYSHQMVEHLHPEDAKEQLENIYTALAPGGMYMCITPNRLSGPHDSSKYFEDVATGWHLKEYLVSELYDLFKEVGFSKISYLNMKGNQRIELTLNGPTVAGLRVTEQFLDLLPANLKRELSVKLSFRGLTIIGVK
jgi:SAM-dependent methyltransferase